ncbi:MAG: hypothetical protein WKF47_07090 [Geodermatophilaceae bacterium]
MVVARRRRRPETSCVANGVEASEVDVQVWGSFVYFRDPDGNTWSLQQLPKRD